MTAQTDATFLRQFLMVLGALVVFTVIILFAANLITSTVEEARGEDPRQRAALVERIKPVGTVNIAGVAPVVTEDAAAVGDAAPARSGEQVAALACNACHLAGVLGAPKNGDGGAWSQRLTAAGGIDGLVTSAINGKGNMPARGGAQVSDAEIRAAVEYMLDQSGVEVAGGAAEATSIEAPTVETPQAGVVEAATEMATGAAGTASSMVAAVTQAPAAATSPTPPTPAPQPVAPPVAEAPQAVAAAPEPVDAPATGGVDLTKGKAIYDGACFACHATGAAGAPKLGDQALWAPRIAKGMEALNHNALNGIGVMPPKGGRVDLSDADIISAVAFMVEQSK